MVEMVVNYLSRTNSKNKKKTYLCCYLLTLGPAGNSLFKPELFFSYFKNANSLFTLPGHSKKKATSTGGLTDQPR